MEQARKDKAGRGSGCAGRRQGRDGATSIAEAARASLFGGQGDLHVEHCPLVQRESYCRPAHAGRDSVKGGSPPWLHILQDSLRRPSWTAHLELHTLPGKSLSLSLPHPTAVLSTEDVREVTSVLGKEHLM